MSPSESQPKREENSKIIDKLKIFVDFIYNIFYVSTLKRAFKYLKIFLFNQKKDSSVHMKERKIDELSNIIKKEKPSVKQVSKPAPEKKIQEKTLDEIFIYLKENRNIKLSQISIKFNLPIYMVKKYLSELKKRGKIRFEE